MSELGDLLERLHRAHASHRTVRATVHRWRHGPRTHAAFLRAQQAQRARGGVAGRSASAITTARGHGPAPDEHLAVERVWIDASASRFRVETEDSHGRSVRVTVGDRWWHFHPLTGAMSNEAEPGTGTGGHGVEELLDPAPLMGMVDLEPLGPATVAGRSAHLVRAVPRPVTHPAAFGLAHTVGGADDILWAVDDERGVLLRTEARLDGEPFARTEVIDVVFDEPLAEELFVFAPPPGEVVRSPRDRVRPEAVTLEEAARRAPFTVLVPARMPEGFSVTAMLLPGRARPPGLPVVVLRMASDDHLHQVSLHQGPDPLRDTLDWERVERGGRSLDVCRPSELDPRVEVRGEHLGTHFRLSGDLDPETLLDMAASLRPAPTEGPRLPAG